MNRKRIRPAFRLFIVIGIILINQLSHAQTSIVPQVGITFTKVINSGEEKLYTEKEFNEKYGFPSLSYGVKVIQLLSQDFSLNLLVDYRKGGSNTTKRSCCKDDGGTKKAEFSYLNFNPSIEYTPFKNFWIGLGIYNSILIKMKWEVNSFVGFQTIDTKYKYSDIDNGISFGLGYTIYSKVRIDLNYHYGIKNVIEEDRNRWIQMNIGYIIGI